MKGLSFENLTSVVIIISENIAAKDSWRKDHVGPVHQVMPQEDNPMLKIHV